MAAEAELKLVVSAERGESMCRDRAVMGELFGPLGTSRPLEVEKLAEHDVEPAPTGLQVPWEGRKRARLPALGGQEHLSPFDLMMDHSESRVLLSQRPGHGGHRDALYQLQDEGLKEPLDFRLEWGPLLVARRIEPEYHLEEIHAPHPGRASSSSEGPPTDRGVRPRPGEPARRLPTPNTTRSSQLPAIQNI